MSSDPKNYFGFTLDEFTELYCRAFGLFETVSGSDITDTELCDAIHELDKFVLCNTEIKGSPYISKETSNTFSRFK